MRRLVVAAFLADFQLYLIYTAMPFKALHLGAGPFELGALAALSTGAYALLVAGFGRMSDRLPRLWLARFSCVGIMIGCIGMTLAPSWRWMLLAAPFVGGSMSPFWPSVQAALADLSRAKDLERNLARFNLAWTMGKASGFLVGATVLSVLGEAATFTLASMIAFTVFFVLPRPRSRSLLLGDEPAPAATAPTAAPAVVETDARADLFRPLAWVANGAAFGLGATLNHHYPRLVREFDWGPQTFGIFLGLVYLTQALTFVALSWRPERWRFRRAPLYVPQLMMIVAIVTLPFADRARVMVSALVFGWALGTCYTASLYYSLHAPAGRGRNAGVHEGLIGLGSMTIPFLGGVLARVGNGLWVPYSVAGVAIVLSLGLQEILYRRGTRRESNPA